MRLVFCGDPHFDAVTAGYPRYDDVCAAFRRTVDYAIEWKADAWVGLGDYFDPDAGGAGCRALDFMSACLREAAEKGVAGMFLLAGNHDVYEDGAGTTTLTPLRTVPWLEVVEVPQACLLTGRCRDGRFARLVALPYTASTHPGGPFGAAEFLSRSLAWCAERGEAAVVVSHLTIPGITPGSETADMPRGREVVLPLDLAERADLAVSGHYHRRQRFGRIHVAGSLCRLTFGEGDHSPVFLAAEL